MRKRLSGRGHGVGTTELKLLSRTPLAHGVMLLVIAPLLLFGAAVCVLYLVNVDRSLEHGVRERGLALVSILAPAAEFSVVTGATDELARLFEVAANHGVLASAVYDQRGALIARRGRGLVAEPALIVAATHAQVVTSAQGRLGFAAPVQTVPRPAALMLEVGTRDEAAQAALTVGWVYIELDGQAFEAAQRVFIATVLLIMAGLLILIAVPSVRLARGISAPLERLADAVRRMAAGDVGVRIPVEASSRELTELEQGFNSMASSIAESQRTLQRKVEEATGLLAYQAVHDPLTGLPNRRAFETALEAAVAGSRRASDHGSLCFIDLDYFKNVNDACGHAAGDALLRAVGTLLAQRLRAQDVVCRIGGDEFALILRGCSREDSRRIADSLQHALASMQFEWKGMQFRIGASLGLVRIDDPAKQPADLLNTADAACYAAKRNGRNRVVESPDTCLA